MNLHAPDYAGGSLVNLMASLAQSLGAPATGYPPLRAPPPALTAGARHVVLLVLDGLGWYTLQRHAQGSTLMQHLHAPLSSVFPSTTASAIPSFLTGVAPQQHALTGWHVYFRELDDILTVLPLRRRGGGALPAGFDAQQLFHVAPLFPRLPAHCSVVTPSRLLGSTFNRLHTRGARCVGYDGLEPFFQRVEGCLREPADRHYVYGYFPDFDGCSHAEGCRARKTLQLLESMDRAFGAFLERIRGSDTLVVVTADHGFVDAAPEGAVQLARHPALQRLLLRPLCGERRLAYCYLRPGAEAAFEDYIRGPLGAFAEAHRSRELLEQGWFGLGRPAPALAGRIGHYTLVMRERCTIKDWVPGERRHTLVGVHGGVSAEEMTVPLVAVRV